MPDPIPSPLLEANPDSLAELFARDPLGLSTQDIDKVIEGQRAQRERWRAAEAAGKPRERKKAGEGQKDFDLDEIGL